VSDEITREGILSRARRHLRPGIPAEAAVVLAYAELDDRPLDPWRFDDAAIVLRAERLLIEGLTVAEALEAARAEHPTWAEAP
jgi:hypothetical protein